MTDDPVDEYIPENVFKGHGNQQTPDRSPNDGSSSYSSDYRSRSRSRSGSRSHHHPRRHTRSRSISHAKSSRSRSSSRLSDSRRLHSSDSRSRSGSGIRSAHSPQHTVNDTERDPRDRSKKHTWNNYVWLVGEKCDHPIFHICEICDKPIVIYGRLKPCNHVFCATCASSLTVYCHKCRKPYTSCDRCVLGGIFQCAEGYLCRRTYLSQRDLQAHIDHRHKPKAPAASSQLTRSATAVAPSAMPRTDHPQPFLLPPPTNFSMPPPPFPPQQGQSGPPPNLALHASVLQHLLGNIGATATTATTTTSVSVSSVDGGIAMINGITPVPSLCQASSSPALVDQFCQQRQMLGNFGGRPPM